MNYMEYRQQVHAPFSSIAVANSRSISIHSTTKVVPTRKGNFNSSSRDSLLYLLWQPNEISNMNNVRVRV
jgi:hypothetical protein